MGPKIPDQRDEDPRNPDRDEPIGDPGMKKTGREELPGDEQERKDKDPTKAV